MIRARYADGRAAITQDAMIELGADALIIRVGDNAHTWAYSDLRRADDGGGRVMLKRKPDTGERLMIEDDSEALRAAAPALLTPKSMGVEGWPVVAGVAATAWSLAAAFLIGVPLAAQPLADRVPERYRSQIADISWSQVNGFTEYCDDSDEAARILNDVADRMMMAANVPHREDIWITIVDAPIPNAFALPDRSIVVTDDLIELAERPDELTGVIAHEIAHIERNHVMANIIRHVGAGIFFDIVFGGAGAGQAIAIASVNLAGLSYSRGDETEADLRGFDYMDAAEINTGGVAALFDRFRAEAEEQGGDIPTLISSHPASAERAAAARARSRTGLAPSMSEAEWRVVRSACGGLPESEAIAPLPAPPEAPKPETLEGEAKPPAAKLLAWRIGGLPSKARAG